MSGRRREEPTLVSRSFENRLDATLLSAAALDEIFQSSLAVYISRRSGSSCSSGAGGSSASASQNSSAGVAEAPLSTRALDAANLDASVYTGGPGVAYALLRVLRGADGSGGDALGGAAGGAAASYLRRCGRDETWLDKQRRDCARDVGLSTSVQCGVAGSLLVEAIRSRSLGDSAAAKELLGEYLRIDTAACRDDEWLYGKTGT